MSRGFFGIGIVHGKTEANIGTLWRSARLYDASFIFTVGRRYRRQASDTPNTPKHTPLFEFESLDDLLAHLPYGCPLVGVELDPRAVPLAEFRHPEQACYLLGAEDHGLPVAALDRCHMLTQIEAPNPQSMNVSSAGTLLMYQRHMQRKAATVNA